MRAQTSRSAPSATPEFDHRAVIRFMVIVAILGLALMATPIALGLPTEPFIMVMTYGLLVGGAVLVARRSGPGGVRRLFSGLLRWRMGWANAVIVVAVLPLATLAVALATGTYVGPENGWVSELGTYLFTTFIFGALLLNVWEETGHQGLIQRHLMGRHGLLKGALLTAIPFYILHIPFQVAGTETVGEALPYLGLLVVIAPAMRYMLGRTDYASGGSLLAVGIFHASFNASGKLSFVDGSWQYAIALGIVAAIALAVDVVRSRSSAGVLYEHRSPGLGAQAAVTQ